MKFRHLQERFLIKEWRHQDRVYDERYTMFSMEENLEGRTTRRTKWMLGFSRMDLAVPPFILAGLGSAFVSAMGGMALGYDSRPITIGSTISYAALLMFFPAFLVALLRRPWTSLPLWLISIVLIAPGLLHPRVLVAPNSIRGERELFGVTLMTEAARLIRGKESEERT